MSEPIDMPPLDTERAPVTLPIVEVTVLEDRARVVRRGVVDLPVGRMRLCVAGVTPVAHDVSLQIEAQGATVVDGRLRRTHRIRRADQPADVQAVTARIETLRMARERSIAEMERAEQQTAQVARMLGQSAAELPVDVSWGLHDLPTWTQTFGDLTGRYQALQRSALEAFYRADDQARAIRDDVRRRAAMERPDVTLIARIEFDLEVTTAGEVQIEIGYVVPNALWRPTHVATLDGETLRIATRAAVWQHTGEDWTDAQLKLSTARGSLGATPPLLDDDLLSATRRGEAVKVAMREVSIERTGPQGASTGAVTLPGVEDGGEVRVLRAEDPQSVPSNGRVVFVPLGAVAMPARAEHICTPELAETVFLEAHATWSGQGPLLAGPVELLRGGGQVGQTTVEFTPSGQPLVIGFGVADDLRVVRTTREKTTAPDRHDPFTHVDTRIALFLSNLGPSDRAINLIERVPVSEVPGVVISAEDGPEPDLNGMRRFEIALPARGQRTVQTRWRMSTAPSVESA
ncbi:MAG: hypothetical protein ACI9U2_002996 [Bradymonadia bacterium]|jgi:uncharacterized protein (TIGR02231 family)